MMATQISAHDLADYHGVVSDVLGRKRGESITGAAFRVLSRKTAAPVVLTVARMMVAASGRPTDEQYEHLARAAEILRRAGYR